jgi:signal peptidase I
MDRDAAVQPAEGAAAAESATHPAPALPAERVPALPTAAELMAQAVPTIAAPAVIERAKPREALRRWLQRCAKPTQAVIASLVAYIFLFNLSVVRGSSMAPRIHDGDRILIDHVSYLFHAVERGDIVVLKYPLDPSVDYIKRVVGLPGDEILIDHGTVWVNGKRLDEPYVDSPDPLTQLYARVQPAHYFVLGDNRRRSSDSREFGQVPVGYVRGKVELRIWPPERVGVIDRD